MPNLLVHDLRRSAVHRMIRRGVSKHTTKRISGHVTDSIFDRYDITVEQDLVEAAGRLEWARSGHKQCPSECIACKSLILQCPSGGTGRRARFRV
jgi:hypothetical protein